MKKKIFATLLACVFAASSWAFLAHDGTSKIVKNGALLVQKRDFHTASKEIDKIKVQKDLFGLLQGYLFFAEKKMTEASAFFKEAEKNCNCDHNELKVEIYLAKALSAYLNRDLKGFETELQSIANATINPPVNPWLDFARALLLYNKQDYAQAFALWNKIDFEKDVSVTKWQSCIYELVFTPAWRRIHMAHARIEGDDFLHAREDLEIEAMRFQAIHDQLDGVATLFIALSYLREASGLPFENRLDCYQMAQYYFEKSEKLQNALQEKQIFASHLKEHAMDLCELSFLPLEQIECLIFPLQRWKDESALESIAERITAYLFECDQEENEALCQNLKKLYEGTLFYRLLREKLIAHITQMIKKGENENLQKGWEKLNQLGEQGHTLTKQLYTLSLDQMQKNVLKDSHELSNTRNYLSFLKKLDETPSRLAYLSDRLIEESKHLWQKEGQEQKAKQLMRLGLELSFNKQQTSLQIDAFLRDLFLQVKGCNLVERLSCLYDALLEFNIQTDQLISPEMVANHLEDAKYRFTTLNFSSCQMLSSWVLKLDPNNQDALRLCGLSLYHLGHFQDALVLLNKLDMLDIGTQKIIALCQTLTSTERAHLVQIDNLDTYNEVE